MQLVAAAFAARADDQVGLAGPDRRDQRRDVARIVRSVRVDEHDDVAGRFVERQAQRVALALAAVEDDPRAVLQGDVARAIRRVAVDDEHLVGIRLDGIDDLADQPFFILGGDDNSDMRVEHGLGCETVRGVRLRV